MIMAPKECMDCPIFIYDTNDNLITETIVTGYGKNEMYIEVSEGLASTALGSRLRLLVIQPEAVSEFSGKLAGFRQGVYEISIHGQVKRDSRSAPRLAFNKAATIGTFLVDSELVQLQIPLNVTIKNISSSGLLVESKDLPLNEGVSMNIEFKLKGRSTIILCKVVRVPKPGADPNSYGCQIIFL